VSAGRRPALRAVRSWPAHAEGICALAWAPDGGLLASAGNEGEVRLWQPATGRPAGVLRGHSGAVRSLAFSPDGGRLLSAAEDRTVVVWRLPGGDAVHRHTDHRRWVNSVCWSPDGRWYASASGDRSLLVYDAVTHRVAGEVASPLGVFLSVAWSPSGSALAASSRSGTILVIRAGDWRVERRLANGFGPVWNVEWIAGGAKLASGDAYGRIVVWDVAAARAELVIAAHRDTVARVTVSPDQALLASLSHDETTAVWSLPGGGLVHRARGSYPGWVYCLACHPVRPLLAGTDRTGHDIRLWRLPSPPASPAGPVPALPGPLASPAGPPAVPAGPPVSPAGPLASPAGPPPSPASPGRALVIEVPALRRARDEMLRAAGRGDLSVPAEAVAAAAGLRRVPSPQQRRLVTLAAADLSAAGGAVVLDRGGRVFLRTGLLPTVWEDARALAGAHGGGVPLAALADATAARLAAGPTRESDAGLITWAFAHEAVAARRGWLAEPAEGPVLFLPEAAPLAGVAPAPETASFPGVARVPETASHPEEPASGQPEPAAGAWSAACWRVTEPWPGAATTVLAGLMHTTLFRRFALGPGEAVLADSAGGLLRLTLRPRPDGTVLLGVHVQAQPGGPGPGAAPGALAALAAELVRALDPGAVEAPGNGQGEIPGTGSPAPAWRGWDDGAPAGWTLERADISEPASALAVLLEQAGDERDRQLRRLALLHRGREAPPDVIVCHDPGDAGAARRLRDALAAAGLAAWSDGELSLDPPPARLTALAERAGVIAVLLGGATAKPWRERAYFPFYQALAQERPQWRPRLRWLPLHLSSAPASPCLSDFLHGFDQLAWRERPRVACRESLLSLIAGIEVDRARN
jgi:WD40 domain-containing protein